MEPSTKDAPSRRETLLPTVAVSAVAVAAVVAAVMVKHTDDPAAYSTAGAQPAKVVTAPPLAPDTKSMGGASACKTCGVVQMVVAVNAAGRSEPRAYQMHIRMDDGSTRTIEQRGALAAGSRVQVEGSSVKPIS